jgi:glycopeptide antibiotics resistance protein
MIQMQRRNSFLTVICWLLLLIWMGVLTKFILFKEPVSSFEQVRKKMTGGHHYGHNAERKNLQLFATIDRIRNSHLSDDYKYKNIGGNILGFVPLGFMIPVLLFRRAKVLKTILLVFLISLFFESVQLYTGLGVFDVDDLLLNTLGGIGGALLYAAVRRRPIEN